MIPANILTNSSFINYKDTKIIVPNGFTEDITDTIINEGPTTFNKCFGFQSYSDDITLELRAPSFFVQDENKLGVYHIVFNETIFNLNFIPDNFIFNIPKRVIEDHKEGKCIIVFDISSDNVIPYGKIKNTIENTIKFYNLIKNNCVLFTCFENETNFLDIKNIGINVVLPTFKIPNIKDAINYSLANKNRKHKIRCLNGKHRTHRFKFFEKIFNNDHLKNNEISYCLLPDFNNSDQLYEIKKICVDNKILDILPLNGKDGGVRNSSDIRKNWHKSCLADFYVEFSVESVCDEKNIFLTEKTARPILSMVPFVLLSSPFSLKNLQNKGFKTFNKWWNESYDNEIDVNKRIDKVFDVFEYINSLSFSDLDQLIIEAHDTLVHNIMFYNRYQSTYKCFDSCKKYFEKLNSDK